MMRGNWPFFSRWPFTMASMMLGWSEPRFTKQWVTPASQRASKKANDVVYILGDDGAAGVVVVVAKLLGLDVDVIALAAKSTPSLL